MRVDMRVAKSVLSFFLLPQRRIMGAFIRIYILFCLILTDDFYAAMSRKVTVCPALSMFSIRIPYPEVGSETRT